MTAYDQAISRDASNDALVPAPMVPEIIKEAVKSSAVLQQCRKVTMSSKTNRQPVLSTKPVAYFVSGDTGLKKTSRADWENAELVAEEIAVIVPVPEAYISDSGVPIWNEVKPLLGEAIGTLLDGACIFGTSAPTTYGDSIFEVADAAGNSVVAGTGDDLAQDISNLGLLLAEQGYGMNGFMSKPGFKWQLAGLRSSDGVPIYQSNLQGGLGDSLYGMPFNEVDDGAWDADQAVLIGGDFTKAIVGLRQDITFKVFTEGVISDESGNVVLNLMQNDSVAMRVVARYGFVTAKPVTALESSALQRAPFGYIEPA